LIKAIDLNEVRDYISKHDTGEPKTVWKLGVLDAHIRAEFEDEISEFEISSQVMKDKATKTQLKINARALKVVRYGIRGFDNFMDETGKPIKFSTETINRHGKSYLVMDSYTLRKIPFKVIQELAAEISKDNILQEEEAKN